MTIIFLLPISLAPNAFSATYSAMISTSDYINIEISPSGNGAKVSSDDIIVYSTCPAGYTISISGPSDTTLYKNGDNTNSNFISASSGTKEHPLSIVGNNMNSWGYSMGDYNEGSRTPASTNSGFVGLTNSITELFSKNEGTPSSGETVPIYFGVSADISLETGSYWMAESSAGSADNTITYYLTTNLDCTSYVVSFNPSSLFEGRTVSGSGVMAEQRIGEDTTATLARNTFTPPTDYYFVGWNTAQDGSGIYYADGQQVSNLVPVGGSLTLYAQWTDCPPNKVCYDKNDGADTQNSVVGTMGQQPIGDSDESIILLASNYSRTKNGFAGWSTKPTTSSDGTITIPNNALTYGPNETIEFATGQYSDAGLKLYAMWVAEDSDSTMQTWEGCSSLNIGEVTALSDARDNNVYAVARLADGNCWMIESLRLETDNSTNASLAQGYGDGTSSNHGKFIRLANPESSNFEQSTVANSYYYSGTQSGTATMDIGTTNYAGYRIPRYNNIATSNRDSNPIDNSGNMYSFGNYYNWPAALANTVHYSSINYTDINGNTSETVGTSICPTNWRLPSGGQKDKIEEGRNDFYNLSYASIGFKPSNYDENLSPYWVDGDGGTNPSNIMRKFPNNLIFARSFGKDNNINAELFGDYWSSNVSSNAEAFRLIVYEDEIWPGDRSSKKSYGFSVRCLTNSN